MPALNAVATEEVSMSADAVWKVIGDYDDIRKWAPAILATKSEQTPAGKVRTLTMPPDGKLVAELLRAESPYSYTYSVIGADGKAADATGTVAVVAIDGGKSRIELSGTFDAAAGQSAEDAIAGKTKFLRGNLKAMKRALGLV